MLINPPFKYLEEPYSPPLGTIILGTILNKNGFETKILDINAEKPYRNNFLPAPLTPKEFLQHYKKFNPDIVGISSVTENYLIALRIARMCKQENDNLQILIGGYHVTFQATECLKQNPFIDIVALGETEHVIVDIIKGMANKREFSNIDNIAYRKNEIIKSNQVTLPDLNKIPAPNFELIEKKFYPSFSLQVEFSRGCIHECAFCCQSPFFKRTPRYFPETWVTDVLERYQQLFKNFSFDITDATFLLDHTKVKRFLEEVKKRNLELKNWLFKTRADLINRDILKIMKNFGAGTCFLGIEDIHDSVLQNLSKSITFAQIKHALKILKELDYFVKGNFVIGLPSQTKNHMLENIAYSPELDYFDFPLIAPFPGSPIFPQPDRYGLKILTKNWELYHGMEIVMDSKTFPVCQQEEIRDLAWRHKATIQLEREFSMVTPRAEWKRLLEVGFDEWFLEWKKTHATGWD